MAEEQLNLLDGMSPSLRRIYLEAERLNKRMLSLRSNIKALEKPASLAYMRKELKSVENQARQTETALRRAVRIGEREGVLSWNARYGGIQHHMMYGQKQYIKDADLIRYGNYLKDVQLRRNRLNWQSGRYVNGLSFEERLARARNKNLFNNLSNTSLGADSSLLSSNFVKLAVTAGILISTFDSLANMINNIIVRAGDEYMGGITRAALTSDRTYTPNELMQNLYNTAIRTRADAEGTISLYNRIAMSGVRTSNDRILRFVETFNKTMAISGTTANENRAVMLQLAQGMGSNRLGGDEFRSIAEQAPMFKYMLAKGLNVNPGALKQMGAEGKLTADAIMSAMEKVQGLIDEIYRTAPWTIGQLLIVLQNKWQKALTQQLTGYIELRNALRDFVSWLDTAEGTEFMQNLIEGINYALSAIVKLARAISPFIRFIINNLKIIITLSTILSYIWLNSKWFRAIGGFTNALKLATTTGTKMWAALSAGAVSFGATCSAILGWIGLIIGAMVVAWNVGQKIADNLQEQRELEAVGVNEQQLALNKEKMWQQYARKTIAEQGYTLVESQVGGGFGTKEASVWNKSRSMNPEYKKWEKDVWSPLEKKIREGNDAWQRENRLGKYKETEQEKLQRELNEMTKSFEGAMDSSKNIPMPVESKGGKLNSVGRIEDDVNLNTDSIQMMKALAERQWIVQNEVTVPQKVDMLVDKSTNVDPQSLAENFNRAIQLATASSMRGEAIV